MTRVGEDIGQKNKLAQVTIRKNWINLAAASIAAISREIADEMFTNGESRDPYLIGMSY